MTFPLLLLMLLFADPPPVQTELRQGLQALQQGHLEEARADLEKGAKTDPANPYIWSSLAEVYGRLGEKQLAATAAQSALKLGANDPIVCQALAIYYWQAGEQTAALPLAEKAAQSNPKVAFQWAQLLLRQQAFTPAVELVEKSLQRHPDDVQLTLTLGVARYGQRRFDDAIAAFLKVIQIDGSIPQPYHFLGRMLDQAGTRLPEIVQADGSWAARNPDNADAQLELAKALLSSHTDDARPEKLLRRAIALDTANWESHYQLGVLLSDQHQFTEAAQELLQAIKLDPKQATPHYRLARVYDRLGQPDKAAEERRLHAALIAAPAK